MRAALASLSLIAVLFAGCAGSDDSGLTNVEDEDPGAPVEVAPGVIVGEKRGGIVGQIRNDAGFLLSEVRVSLLDTDYFTDTKKDGAFRFLNLTPGAYRLFAQANNYQPVERVVNVSAANVTTVEVFLLPLQSVGAGYVPHLHDFWAGRSEVTIMDHDVDLSEPRRQDGRIYSRYYNAIYEPNSNGTESGWWQFAIAGNTNGDPAIIFPGTKEIVVTFTWSNTQVTLPRLGLAYGRPQDSPPHVPKTWLPPQASNVAWTVRLNPEDSDTGHQSFSFWRFYVYSGNSASGSPSTWQPGLILGNIHIKMVIKKGEVAPEPAHENFWNGKDTIRYELYMNRTQVFGERGIPGSYAFSMPSGKLIPPGTAKMRLQFWYAYCDQYTSCNANGSAADRNQVLTWRSADMHPFDTGYAQYHRLAPIHNSKHHKVYEFEVKPGQTDAYYQKRTNWLFVPSAQGEENQDYYLEGRGIQFRLFITLFRDPTYDLG